MFLLLHAIPSREVQSNEEDQKEQGRALLQIRPKMLMFYYFCN